YWTEGGSLRNVPVGGGSRKNKRSSSSISSSHSSMAKKLPDLVTISELIQVPNFDATKNTTTNTSNTTSAQQSAMELLTGLTSRGMMMNSFMPIPNPDPSSIYSSSGQMMIPMPDFKIPSLNFSLDAMGGNGGGGTYGSSIHEGSNGRLLFPFEDLKTSATSTTNDGQHNVEENRDHNGDTNGFWSGMLGGGQW
nr:DOF zinc finger protein DOF1.8-like isoform X1 [Tanacetum cinerariifolium]